MTQERKEKYVKSCEFVVGNPYRFLINGKWTPNYKAKNPTIDKRRRRPYVDLFERYTFDNRIHVIRVKGTNGPFIAPGHVHDVTNNRVWSSHTYTCPFERKGDTTEVLKKKAKRPRKQKKSQNQSANTFTFPHFTPNKSDNTFQLPTLSLESTDEEDNNDTDTNTKNTLSGTHNPRSKQTLLKSRNRFDLKTKGTHVPQFRSQPPPTLAFYTYEEKQSFIDKFEMKFKSLKSNSLLSAKQTNSINQALSDISDAPKYGIPISRYHAICELYMHFMGNTAANQSKQFNKNPLKSINECKKESNHKNKSNMSAKQKIENIFAKDYCHVCNEHFSEKRNANNNVIQSVSIHFKKKREKEKEKEHMSADKYVCHTCNISFPNAIVLQSHNSARHAKITRKGDGKTDIVCGHDCKHSVECNSKSCRKAPSDDPICECKSTICKSYMYASWKTQKAKYVAMCEDKRCRYQRVPPKCEGNPKNSQVCQICDITDMKCEWAKINGSIKSKEELLKEFEAPQMKNKSEKSESENENQNDVSPQKSNDKIIIYEESTDDYTKISKILEDYCGKAWKQYLSNFMAEEVTDEDIEFISDKQLEVLIPKMGPRQRFSRQIESEKQTNDN